MKELILVAALLSQEAAAPTPNVLSGQISYFDGQAASNITVVAVPTGSLTSVNRVNRTVRTNVEGMFRFEGLPEGDYLIQTVPVGASTFYPGVASEADATALTVTANSILGNINFRLTAAASGVRVRGRVAVPEGQPLNPAATVRIMGGSPLQFRQGPIAADGTFEVPNVRPGTHTVAIDGGPGEAFTAITVGDSDMDGIDLIIPRLMTVRGSVAMDPRGPVPQLTLTFAGQTTSLRRTSRTSAEGAFEISLPAGIYAITVDGQSQNHYIKSMNAESGDLRDGVLILNESAKERTLAIILGTSPGIDVAGRVLVDGKTDANITGQLLVRNRIVGRRYQTQIHDDGAFALQNVMPGGYSVAVLTPGAISPPLSSFTIPESGGRDIEISVPGLVEISGRVTVAGSGPPPKFRFALVQGNVAAGLADLSGVGQLPVLSPDSALQLLRPDGGSQILQVEIDALPDGTFQFGVPAGEYRVAALGEGIPAAFLLRSINYGSARLTEEPMIVPAAGSTEQLEFGFSPTAPKPWLKLSGMVVGVDAAASPMRVALEGGVTSAIETPVNFDGSFEFQSILRDSTYTARIVPEMDAAPAPSITVTDRDLSGVTIEIPRRRDVLIRTAVEGGGVIPGYILSLASASSTVQVPVTSDRSGAFRASLPEDGRKVRFTGLPLGYVVKTMTYGSADLLKTPLRIAGTPAGSELLVTLTADDAVPFANLQGRISGLAPDAPSPRLALHSAAAIGSYETTIAADGTFNFLQIPQGLYAPAFVDEAAARILSPSLIVVGGPDTTLVELAARPSPSRGGREPVTEALRGARVTDITGPSVGSDSAIVASLRTINTALITFRSASGRYGNIAEMIDAGLLDNTFAGEIAGYRFAVIAVGNQYAAAGIPASTGGYGFFSTPDAIVRYSTVDLLAPPNRVGVPVQ